MSNQTSNVNLLIQEADKKKLSGKHSEAIKICEKILTQDLDCLEAYEEIGDNYLSLRQYEKAKKALTRALQINPRSANANYLLGFVFSAIGEWQKSIDYLDRADNVEPNHPEILRCLGWSIFHKGERKRGIFILERALNLAGNDPLILSDLGVCYLNEKNFERSSYLFKKVLEIEPHNEKAKECLNAVRFFQKEFRKFREKNA
ncbi:tetratricopeptide repeat protein [Patescibacteria group bacterium]|nr:tetratricopeptide repeat protein [Patescibacteria group bacterium]MBU1703619.1 tetratricopeptide repeat protein [Patescibacteria group bacterium]MBU1953928.1 tetratricopeptide repeat protein [Patescibacteria group bacterium]